MRDVRDVYLCTQTVLNISTSNDKRAVDVRVVGGADVAVLSAPIRGTHHTHVENNNPPCPRVPVEPRLWRSEPNHVDDDDDDAASLTDINEYPFE